MADKGEEPREEIFVHLGLHHYPSTSLPRWTNISSLVPRTCLPTRFTSIHIPVDIGILTAPLLNFVQSRHKLSSTLFVSAPLSFVVIAHKDTGTWGTAEELLLSSRKSWFACRDNFSARRSKKIQPGAPACLSSSTERERGRAKILTAHESESCVTRSITHAFVRRHVLQGKPNLHIWTHLWSLTPIPGDVLQDTRATLLPRITRSKYDDVYMLTCSCHSSNRCTV